MGEPLRDAAPLIFGLGRAYLPTSVVGLLHGAFQPHLDQMQHAPVHDAPRKRQHQFGVRNGPEVVRKVGVYNFRVASEQRLFHLDHRLLGIAARPVGILLGWKVGFKDRLEHQHRCCHAHSIAQGRNAQWPELGALRRRVGLRYEHPSDRIRSVVLIPERKRQFAEPPLHAIRLDIREVLTVHARCALVRAALGPGMGQDVLTADLVVQRVEAKARLQPSLSRVTPSAVSEHSPELLGCPISRSLTTYCVCLEPRPLPSPALPGFSGTTSLSATPGRPACPSPESGWSSPTTPRGFPCCARSPCVHAAATTPAQRLAALPRSSIQS